MQHYTFHRLSKTLPYTTVLVCPSLLYSLHEDFQKSTQLVNWFLLDASCFAIYYLLYGIPPINYKMHLNQVTPYLDTGGQEEAQMGETHSAAFIRQASFALPYFQWFTQSTTVFCLLGN